MYSDLTINIKMWILIKIVQQGSMAVNTSVHVQIAYIFSYTPATQKYKCIEGTIMKVPKQHAHDGHCTKAWLIKYPWQGLVTAPS